MMNGDRKFAVVLAGGRGSRLKPYTHVLPKPLMPVCDAPILEVVINQLRDHGFCDLTLAVNHLEGLVRSYFGDGGEQGVAINYSKEDRPLGTVGPLRLLADRLPESFLVMNGDLLTDISFSQFYEAHTRSKCVLTVGTFTREHLIADGVIDTDEAGLVTGFREKPRYETLVSMGVYMMSRDVLNHIPEDRPFGMDDLILRLLEHNIPINTFHHRGEWYDIGCPEDLENANIAFAERRPKFIRQEQDTLVNACGVEPWETNVESCG